MIDTDRYTGHAEGPWRTAEGQPYDDEGSHLDIVDANGVLVTETSYFTDNNHPNAQLIADAPLFLAEVVRLREVISRAISTLLDNPPEELFEFTSPTPAQDIGDIIGFYTQAMGYAIGILEGTE